MQWKYNTVEIGSKRSSTSCLNAEILICKASFTCGPLEAAAVSAIAAADVVKFQFDRISEFKLKCGWLVKFCGWLGAAVQMRAHKMHKSKEN